MLPVMMSAGKFLWSNGPALIAAIVGLLGAMYALALLIPGDQPDKMIKAIYDFTVKFSSKKSEDEPKQS